MENSRGSSRAHLSNGPMSSSLLLPTSALIAHCAFFHLQGRVPSSPPLVVFPYQDTNFSRMNRIGTTFRRSDGTGRAELSERLQVAAKRPHADIGTTVIIDESTSSRLPDFRTPIASAAHAMLGQNPSNAIVRLVASNDRRRDLYHPRVRSPGFRCLEVNPSQLRASCYSLRFYHPSRGQQPISLFLTLSF